MKAFLLLIFSVVAATFVIIFSIRMLGTSNTYADPNHAFNRGAFEVIAHRGGAIENPENTMHAFETSFGVDPNIILEFDVRLSEDGIPVIIHDDTVDRTTNGTGKVSEKTLDELRELNAAAKFEGFEGELKIPTLNEFFERFANKARFVLEVKEDQKISADKVIQTIEEHNIDPATFIIGSFHSRVIDYMREKKPNWNYSASQTEGYRTVILENMFLETVDPMKPTAFLIPEESQGIKVLTRRFLNETKKRKKPVYIWTINEEKNMRRLIDFGVDGLITDRPKFLFELVN